MRKTEELHKLMNSYRQKSGKGLYHTHLSMMDDFRGIFLLNRQGLEDLFQLHSDAISNPEGRCAPEYLSGVSEKPQTYSMFRSDVDKKEETESTTPYEMYNVFDALNLIKDIQQYLKENIKGVRPHHLDCAFMTKPPYISEDGYNKHGFHLQFVNCFLSKEDNERITKYFHNKDENYDKCAYYAPWLLYGSQKKRTTGRYKVNTIVKGDGTCVKPEEYFTNYKIYDKDEKQIEFTKDIAWYYPRIFSIIPYN